jgi:hypothetical protein
VYETLVLTSVCGLKCVVLKRRSRARTRATDVTLWKITREAKPVKEDNWRSRSIEIARDGGKQNTQNKLTNVCIHAHTEIQESLYLLCTQTRTNTHTRTHTHTHTCMHICMYVYGLADDMNIYIHVHIYIYIMYKHTHTYTHASMYVCIGVGRRYE